MLYISIRLSVCNNFASIYSFGQVHSIKKKNKKKKMLNKMHKKTPHQPVNCVFSRVDVKAQKRTKAGFHKNSHKINVEQGILICFYLISS